MAITEIEGEDDHIQNLTGSNDSMCVIRNAMQLDFEKETELVVKLTRFLHVTLSVCPIQSRPGYHSSVPVNVGLWLEGTYANILNTRNPTKVCHPWKTIGNRNPNSVSTYLLET